jgi:hypothetical protein
MSGNFTSVFCPSLAIHYRTIHLFPVEMPGLTKARAANSRRLPREAWPPATDGRSVRSWPQTEISRPQCALETPAGNALSLDSASDVVTYVPPPLEVSLRSRHLERSRGTRRHEADEGRDVPFDSQGLPSKRPQGSLARDALWAAGPSEVDALDRACPRSLRSRDAMPLTINPHRPSSRFPVHAAEQIHLHAAR